MFAPGQGGCDACGPILKLTEQFERNVDDENTTISTNNANEAALEDSEQQKQLMNYKEDELSLLRFNQSESSSLNLTNTSLGSPIIGTLIGKAIGDSANSDDDSAREAKKLNEFALRPNQSDSLSPNSNFDDTTDSSIATTAKNYHRFLSKHQLDALTLTKN